MPPFFLSHMLNLHKFVVFCFSIKKTVATHLCDTSWCPDMVVLQHHHSTEVLSMHGHAANQHGVLFHQTEARCGFARAGHFSGPTSGCGGWLEQRRARGDPRGPGQAVESRPLPEEEAPGWASNHSRQRDGILTCEGEAKTLERLELGVTRTITS